MVRPQPLTCEPWIPLFARIDTMVEAEPCRPPCGVDTLAPVAIPHSQTPCVILSVGLFSHNQRTQRVLAKSTWSPTGYGIRPLAPQELWNLWNLPILLQDVAVHEPTFASSISALMSSAPAKVLLSGGKCLLSDSFRGGDASRKRQLDREGGEPAR